MGPHGDPVGGRRHDRGGLLDSDAPRPAARRLGTLAICALAAGLLVAYGSLTRHGPALADEFIYLAGARHFARSLSLDARYYDADAILRLGHPHQDVHSPGYVILLGAVMAAVRGTYWTAVALNVAAYAASALLVRGLAVAVGRSPRAAWVAGALYLVLPAFLPYVFWAMAEVVLGALFLAALWVAARRGDTRAGAVLAGLLFGAAFLVRESALFGLPALVGLLWGRGRMKAFLTAFLAFVVLVYAPLSRHRAPGGANFWAPTSGKAFGYQAVQAARGGKLGAAAALARDRASRNLEGLLSSGTVEKGILATFAFMALCASAAWRQSGTLGRRMLAGLWIGLALMLAVLFGVYVVAEWSGFRYLMFLVPALIPFVVSTLDGSGPLLRRAALPALLAAAGAGLDAGVLPILTAYKASRQKRQEGIAAYVERYVDPRQATRIGLTNGWLFGLRHYPVEVISSLPDGGGELRMLERAVSFDYLVLPGDTPLAGEMDGRAKYRLLNRQEPDPPLRVYRRLR